MFSSAKFTNFSLLGKSSVLLDLIWRLVSLYSSFSWELAGKIRTVGRCGRTVLEELQLLDEPSESSFDSPPAIFSVKSIPNAKAGRVDSDIGPCEAPTVATQLLEMDCSLL